MTIQAGPLQPSYLTVDPTTGLVGADFTGVINADGIIIPGGTVSNPPNTNKIIWTGVNGAAIAEIYANQPSGAGGQPNLTVEAISDKPTDQAQAAIGAFDSTGQTGASLTGISQSIAFSSLQATASKNTGVFSAIVRKIIDSGGLSDFAQVANNLSDLASAVTARTNLGLGTAAVAALTSLLQVANNLSDLNNIATARTNLGIATGNGNVVWTASQSSAGLVINHGLGRIPIVVVAMPSGSGAITIGTTYGWGSGSNTQFTLFGWRSASSSITIPTSWIAIG